MCNSKVHTEIVEIFGRDSSVLLTPSNLKALNLIQSGASDPNIDKWETDYRFPPTLPPPALVSPVMQAGDCPGL